MSFHTRFFRFLRASFIWASFDLCGLNSIFLFLRSSSWRVFQKEGLFSLLSQPILIACQKCLTCCSPKPLLDFGGKRTSLLKMLALPLTTSSVSVDLCSPQ